MKASGLISTGKMVRKSQGDLLAPLLTATIMDRISREYIRGAAQVGWLRAKVGETELVWTCAAERYWVYWEKDVSCSV